MAYKLAVLASLLGAVLTGCSGSAADSQATPSPSLLTPACEYAVGVVVAYAKNGSDPSTDEVIAKCSSFDDIWEAMDPTRFPGILPANIATARNALIKKVQIDCALLLIPAAGGSKTKVPPLCLSKPLSTSN